MNSILVTGASGFIGTKLYNGVLKNEYRVAGLDASKKNAKDSNFYAIDLCDFDIVSDLCNIIKPSVIIHCAGIAHQKLGSIDSDEYFRVNSEATEDLAKAAIKANPDVYFIFLSSISVYGEDNNNGFVSEKNLCNPSSDYAASKLDAEKRLINLHNSGFLNKLDILRLAPVYDSDWSLNLDRRVFAPKKLAYLKFGSGEQEMSAVSRQNLVQFIEYRINQGKNNSVDSSFFNIINVCDKKPYKFKEIITVFKKSVYHPNRIVFTVPLSFVWIATRFAGLLFKGKKQWLHSCHDKLKYSLIFDNSKMLNTGFKHKHSLESVFSK